MVPHGPPEIHTGNTTITILSVGPAQDDHDVLERLLQRPKWLIHRVPTLSSAVALLQQVQIPVVICERDLQPGTWKDMLDHLKLLSQPPCLIVTSWLADDHLWSEALNLGAYDVLAKPFDRTEVSRILGLASLHWHEQDEADIHPPKTVSAPRSRMSGGKYAVRGAAG